MQVVGQGRDFFLEKRMSFTIQGAEGGRIFFLRILIWDKNFDLPKSHTTSLKEIISLSVDGLVKKNFKAG